MAKSNARPGFGAKLLRGAGDSPETYTEVAEIVNIPGIGTTHRTSEVTHMSSPNGWAEHIGLGVKEGKAFSVDVNFVGDDSDQEDIYKTLVADGSLNNWRIHFTDIGKTMLTFGAIVTDTDINHERDSHAQATYSFLPSGGYAWGTFT